MSISSSTAVQNGGNRFFLPIGNRRLRQSVQGRAEQVSVGAIGKPCLPTAMDGIESVVPPESLRKVGRSFEIGQSWLISRFNLPCDVLGAALDEVRGWGVQIDFTDGVWFDRLLFNQVLMYQPLKVYFTAEDIALVRSLLEAKR